MEPSPASVVAEHAARGELAYQLDEDGSAQWPPRVGPFTWAVSAGRGTVYATTIARPRGEEPRDVTLVDLDEGFRVMTTILGGPLPIGARVQVAWRDGLACFEAERPPATAGART